MKVRLIKEPTPTLHISEKLYAELLSYVRSTTLEMTLVLEIEKLNKLKYEIKAINIPPQWNEPAESKTLDSKYIDWCENLILKGHTLNGHMHTHPNFSVTPSGYDIQFFNNLINDTNTFAFRIIMNHEGLITVDLIDKEDNIIAEKMDLTIDCKTFKLNINDATKYIHDIDDKNIKYCVNTNLEATVYNKYLAVTKSKISIIENNKTADKLSYINYIPVRKQDTDEGMSTSKYNYNYGKSLLEKDEEDMDIYEYYDRHFGQDSYKK